MNWLTILGLSYAVGLIVTTIAWTDGLDLDGYEVVWWPITLAKSLLRGLWLSLTTWNK